MTLREDEFRILRETIAWRGTIRMILCPVAVIGWASAWTALLLAGERGLGGLIALAVLLAGFEAVYALHSGVERIGRYIQVNYENTARPGPLWESTAMRLGPGLPGGGIDPLFATVFVLATAANLALVITDTATSPFARLVLAMLHAGLVVRIVRARRAAAQQRAIDLETFRAVRTELEPPEPAPPPT